MVAAAITALKTVRHLAAVTVVVAVAVQTVVVNQASVTPNSAREPTMNFFRITQLSKQDCPMSNLKNLLVKISKRLKHSRRWNPVVVVLKTLNQRKHQPVTRTEHLSIPTRLY